MVSLQQFIVALGGAVNVRSQGAAVKNRGQHLDTKRECAVGISEQGAQLVAGVTAVSGERNAGEESRTGSADIGTARARLFPSIALDRKSTRLNSSHVE